MRVLPLALVLLACRCDRSPPPAVRTTLHSDVTPPAAPVAAPPDTSFLPPSTPVDLDASVRDAVAGAATALHAKTVDHTEVDSFVLVNADRGAHYAAAVALARRAVAAFFESRFDRHAYPAVTVLVFSSDAAYDAFCRARSGGVCPTRFGDCDRPSRTIVMHATAGAETLAHEMVHPIVQADFPRAPAWLDEGIASLFEAPVFCSAGHVTGVTNWRYPQLVAALGSPGGARVRSLGRPGADVACSPR